MKHDAGYTLTEMLVVMAIIGLIAAVLTPALVGQLGRARAKTAQMQLQTIAAGLEMYRSDVGKYPTSSEGLGVLLSPAGEAEGWVGPYLKDSKSLVDPWGNAIQYALGEGGRSYVVTSYGADGTASGSGLDRDIQAKGQ